MRSWLKEGPSESAGSGTPRESLIVIGGALRKYLFESTNIRQLEVT